MLRHGPRPANAKRRLPDQKSATPLRRREAATLGGCPALSLRRLLPAQAHIEGPLAQLDVGWVAPAWLVGREPRQRVVLGLQPQALRQLPPGLVAPAREAQGDCSSRRGYLARSAPLELGMAFAKGHQLPGLLATSPTDF